MSQLQKITSVIRKILKHADQKHFLRIFILIGAVVAQVSVASAQEQELQTKTIAECRSTRIDIVDLPHDSYRLQLKNIEGTKIYLAEVRDLHGNMVAQFQGNANEALLEDNMIAFEQAYPEPHTQMSSQSLNFDIPTRELSWGQYLGCSVVVSALFVCD